MINRLLTSYEVEMRQAALAALDRVYEQSNYEQASSAWEEANALATLGGCRMHPDWIELSFTALSFVYSF